MKTILLHVYEDSGFESRLQVALDIVRAHEAHLVCVQPTTQYVPMSLGPMGDGFVSSVDFAQLEAAEREYREKIEKRLKTEAVSWDWHTSYGDPATLLTDRSSLADLVIVSQSLKGDAMNKPLPIAGDVAIYSDCATMVVPPESGSFDCQAPVMVAWNGSAESAKAVRLTIAMLKMASEVHLVTVGEERDGFPHVEAATYLTRHGVPTTLHELDGKGKETSAILADFAVEKNVSAVVMGAYGHSRLREILFGGVTKNLLGNTKVPLIMGH